MNRAAEPIGTMKPVLLTAPAAGRKLIGNNRGANLALSKHLLGGDDTGSSLNSEWVVSISIESEESDVITDSGSENFFALLRASKPNGSKEISVEGPKRNTKGQ